MASPEESPDQIRRNEAEVAPPPGALTPHQHTRRGRRRQRRWGQKGRRPGGAEAQGRERETGGEDLR